MRYLIVCDLHASNHPIFPIDEGGVNGHLRLVERLINTTLPSWWSGTPTTIVFLGDLMECVYRQNKVHVGIQEMLISGIQYLRSIGFSVAVIAGNHDAGHKGSWLTVHKDKFDILCDVDQSLPLSDKYNDPFERTVVLIGHSHDKEVTQKAIEQALVYRGDGKLLIMGHFGVTGSAVENGGVYRWDDGVDLSGIKHVDCIGQMILGHVHHGTPTDKPLVYAGLPLPYSWVVDTTAYADATGTILALDTNGLTRRTTGAPRFVSCTVKDWVAGYSNRVYAGDFVRLVATFDERDEAMMIQSSTVGVHIRPIYTSGVPDNVVARLRGEASKTTARAVVAEDAYNAYLDFQAQKGGVPYTRDDMIAELKKVLG